MAKHHIIKTTKPTVGTTATSLVNNNPSRVAILFSNRGTNAVTIDNDNGVTTVLGFILDSNGGALNFLKSEDGDMPSLEFFGIAGVAQQIVIKEVLAVEDKEEK